MHFITLLVLLNTHSPITKDTSKKAFNIYSLAVTSPLAANYYTTTTSFFCNTERTIEKKTKLNLKFRLGSVEQTQKMEGYNLSSKTP